MALSIVMRCLYDGGKELLVPPLRIRVDPTGHAQSIGHDYLDEIKALGK